MVKYSEIKDKMFEAKKDDEELVQDIKKNKKVKMSDVKKVKRYKVPSTAKGDKFELFVKTILKNMNLRMKGNYKSMLLLAGKPGTGKTSSIRQLAKLFGMNLAIIEGSVVTNETLVNIPYILIDAKNDKKIEDTIDLEQSDDGGYKLVNAESSLLTRLKKYKPITDAQHRKILEKNKLLKIIYDKYKVFIDRVRKKSVSDKSGFSTMLLLDEYFRTDTSSNVQNMLRSILNGEIGNDTIPDDIYIIAASNIDDEGVTDIALNQQFSMIDFDEDYASSKDDFMKYMADKYTPVDSETNEEDDKIKLSTIIDPVVYNAFEDKLTSADLGYEDPNSEFRLSPRRLEQIILYVNSRIPVSNEKDVASLYKYLKSQFSNYQTGETSVQYKKFKEIVQSIIQETTPSINVNVAPLSNVEWKKVFLDELQARINDTGENISYPIILSGMPGVSKTTSIANIAKENDMISILIDCSSLDPDDIVGIPLPKENKAGVETVFSEPPLYKKIMKKYNDAKALLKKNGGNLDKTYNVILNLDEMNRVKDITVFNKLRSLLLDKYVSLPDFTLPSDILIMSTMNPNDENTMDLPKHFADVLDFIPVELSINDTEDFLQSMNIFKDEEDYLGFNVRKISFSVLNNIYTRLKSEIDMDGNKLDSPLVYPFYWNIGNNVIYVSPRELSDMYQSIIQNIHDEFTFNHWDTAFDNISDEREHQKLIKSFIAMAKEQAYIGIRDMVKFIGTKQHVEMPDINKFLKAVIKIINENKIFEEVIQRTIKNDTLDSMSFSKLFEKVNYDVNKLKDLDGISYLTQYLQSVNDVNEPQNDLSIVFNYAQSNYSPNEYLIFIKQIIEFLDDIEWKKISSGNGIKNSLAILGKSRLDAFINNSMIGNAEVSNYILDHYDEFTKFQDHLNSMI